MMFQFLTIILVNSDCWCTTFCTHWDLNSSGLLQGAVFLQKKNKQPYFTAMPFILLFPRLRSRNILLNLNHFKTNMQPSKIYLFPTAFGVPIVPVSYKSGKLEFEVFLLFLSIIAIFVSIKISILSGYIQWVIWPYDYRLN